MSFLLSSIEMGLGDFKALSKAELIWSNMSAVFNGVGSLVLTGACFGVLVCTQE